MDSTAWSLVIAAVGGAVVLIMREGGVALVNWSKSIADTATADTARVAARDSSILSEYKLLVVQLKIDLDKVRGEVLMLQQAHLDAVNSFTAAQRRIADLERQVGEIKNGQHSGPTEDDGRDGA